MIPTPPCSAHAQRPFWTCIRILNRNWRTVLPLAALIVATSACRTTTPVALIDVPFYRQDPHQCGAAALGMVLAFHGHPADIPALESEIFIPALRGTIPALMVESARRRGLDGNVTHASFDNLMEAVARGTPPIVLLAPESPQDVGHFLVITGVKGGGAKLRTHGPNAPDVWWTRTDFLARWEPADHIAVILTPTPASIP